MLGGSDLTEQQLLIFISYSRKNSDFVDRLEADLRARGYRTWVDRHRLEGGVDWKREINSAIAACDLFLLVLSQAAVDSEFVRYEFEEAQQLGKRLMPIQYRSYFTRGWLAAANSIQWVDFTDAFAYEKNLRDLIYAIQDPTLNLSADDKALYSSAKALRENDPERAAIILQHLVDRTPTYFGGQAQRDLVDLTAQLYPARVERLRAQAEQAHRDGLYGVEVASLVALIALGDQNTGSTGPSDTVLPDQRQEFPLVFGQFPVVSSSRPVQANQDATYIWAKEYLPIAQQNYAMSVPYGNVQDLIAVGDITVARDLLQKVWKEAPYFCDPANLAPKLGLSVPPTYEEAKAVEAVRKLRAKASEAERERFRKAAAILQSDLSHESISAIRHKLREYNYDLNTSQANSFIEQMLDLWNQSAHRAKRAASMGYQTANGDPWVVFRFFGLIVWMMFAPFAVCALSANYFAHQVTWTTILLALSVGLLGGYLIIRWINSGTARHNRKYENVRASAEVARAEADSAYQQWRALAEQVLQRRIDTINQG